MNKKILFSLMALSGILVSCNSGSGSNSVPNETMNVKVTPNSSGVCSNVNSPCVSVTVCSTGNLNCTTVNNILLDTGSYGLRVFDSALGSSTVNSLTPIRNGSNPIGECVTYGDGSQNWGGIYFANVKLSSDAIASNVPIQVINSNFNTPPSACGNATTSPNDFGYNGVLGVGVYKRDGGRYYSCNGSNCSATYSMPSNQQVANPVAMLPENNNGITIHFEPISSTGGINIGGTVNFGVNTNYLNTVTTSNVYTADLSQGLPLFNANYNSTNYLAFLDTGTNTLAMSNSGLPSCASPYNDFLCPQNTTNLSINNINSNGTAIPSVISIANTMTLLSYNQSAYNNLGSTLPFGEGNLLDYGLPFFYGKNIQLVFEDSQSNLGTGPFWAW